MAKSLRKSKSKRLPRKSVKKSVNKTAKKSAKKPVKKSVRKSAKKPVKKSPRKSPKKAVKKSVRKSAKKPVKKSVRKSPKKAVKKSVRKSPKKAVKKSVRKSPKKAVKKSVRKSPKKAVKKSVRKSPKKAVKKSVRKSPKKAVKKSVRKSVKKPVKKASKFWDMSKDESSRDESSRDESSTDESSSDPDEQYHSVGLEDIHPPSYSSVGHDDFSVMKKPTAPSYSSVAHDDDFSVQKKPTIANMSETGGTRRGTTDSDSSSMAEGQPSGLKKKFRRGMGDNSSLPEKNFVRDKINFLENLLKPKPLEESEIKPSAPPMNLEPEGKSVHESEPVAVADAKSVHEPEAVAVADAKSVHEPEAVAVADAKSVHEPEPVAQGYVPVNESELDFKHVDEPGREEKKVEDKPKGILEQAQEVLGNLNPFKGAVQNPVEEKDQYSVSGSEPEPEPEQWKLYKMDGCEYCKMAHQALLKRVADDPDNRKLRVIESADKNHKIVDSLAYTGNTWPKIFRNGKFLGGYNDLEKYIEEHK